LTENAAIPAAERREPILSRKQVPLDTVYSLSGEVPPIEAAVEEADSLVFQPGSVVLGSIRQVCLIRKISAGGAVLHADLPVEEGERLELELETGEHLDGRIAWRRGSELGLRFDEAIDVLPILARNLVSQPGERRRMPRVEVFCPARLEAGSRTVLVTIRDISQGGVKIEAPFTATPEDRVLIAPEGLRPIEGIVRWAHGNVAGIGFEPELAWQELMPWLRLGTLLWIVLPGLEGWPARIVGIDGYRFTCEFTQPLHPAVLERILATAKTASN
jgi:hypothetical protein